MDIITNIILPKIEYILKKNQSGETLLYIISKTAYKPRKDQTIRKSCVLESTFIWKNKTKKSNIILGVGYRHPIIDYDWFNDIYVNKLLDNIAKENGTVFTSRFQT